MVKKILSISILLFLAPLFAFPYSPLAYAAAAPEKQRPAEWAQPLEAPGLDNLHIVTGNIYRSAQPTAEGVRSAEKFGIKTVLSLRAFNDDDEIAVGSPLNFKRIPIHTWSVSEDEIFEALCVLTLNEEEGPFLVHCQHGADRTGLLIASYRIVVQGWSKEAALDELQNGGYGFHSLWTNIPKFIKKMDPDAWRQRLELTRKFRLAETAAPKVNW